MAKSQLLTQTSEFSFPKNHKEESPWMPDVYRLLSKTNKAEQLLVQVEEKENYFHEIGLASGLGLKYVDVNPDYLNDALGYFTGRKKEILLSKFDTLQIGDKKVRLHKNLESMIEQIEDSEYLLYLNVSELEDGYLKPIDENYYNAIQFLCKYANELINYDSFLEIPTIQAVKNGSIDLEWFSSDDEKGLLINFSNLDTCSFYGYIDGGNKSLKGTLGFKKTESYFIEWLRTNFTQN